MATTEDIWAEIGKLRDRQHEQANLIASGQVAEREVNAMRPVILDHSDRLTKIETKFSTMVSMVIFVVPIIVAFVTLAVEIGMRVFFK